MDNCSAVADITVTQTLGAFVPDATCPNAGTYKNTFIAEDGCGNTSGMFTQLITITDDIAPTWASAVGSLDVALDCGDAAGLAAAEAMMPTPTDNCSASGDITITKTQGTLVAGSCPHIGTITNTFTATDECMNPTVCLLYTSPSPRDATLSRMPSSA